MEINRNNYRNWLLKYMEDELSKNDKLKVEGFTILHEEAAEELRKLEQTRLQPDKDIVFPKKQLLMKRDETEIAEETPAPFPIRKMSRIWMSAAAIAAMLLIALLFRMPVKNRPAANAVKPPVHFHQPKKEINTPVLPNEQLAQVKDNKPAPKTPHKSGKSKTEKKEKSEKKESLSPVVKPQLPEESHSAIIVQNAPPKPKPNPEAIKKLVALGELVNLAKNTSQTGRSTTDIPATNAVQKTNEETDINNDKSFLNNLGEFFRYRLSIGRQHEGSAYAVSFKTPEVDISKTLK
jgi:hypothetical protein